MASIEARPDGSYRITVSEGYDSTGKKLRHRETVTATDLEGLTERQKLKELDRRKALFEEWVKNGQYLDGEKITLAAFVERWLADYAEKQYQPKTFYETKRMLDLRILPALGHIRLAKLQPVHLIEFYNNLSENGMRLDNLYLLKKSYTNVLDNADIINALDRKTRQHIKSGGSTRKDSAQRISDIANIPFNTLFSPVNTKKVLSPKTLKKARYNQPLPHHFKFELKSA